MRESFKIEGARARLVFDSRGDETIEVELWSGGYVARVSSPAGKSRGKREVQYYPNDSVAEAVRVFNERLAPRIVGVDPADQEGFDGLLKEVDGTGRFERIGGNTAFASSVAAALLSSKLKAIPLYQHISESSGLSPRIPLPLGNVLGGGAHAGGKAPDIQEILVFSRRVEKPEDAIRSNIQLHKRLGKRLTEVLEGFTRGRGDEGAYAPNMGNEEALRVVRQVLETASGNMAMGVDMASSNLYNAEGRRYVYKRDNVERSREEQITYVAKLVEELGLRYVEDPLEEDDMEGFTELMKQVGNKTLICGDDLLTTNASKIREAAKAKAVNAVIIKPNQVGTLSDTYEAAREAGRHGMVRVVSHRSGETCDGVLAHIAVGLGASLIKCGVVGGERVAKVNELLRIWEGGGGKVPLAEVLIG